MALVPVGVPRAAPTPPPNLLLYISAVTLLYLCNKDFSGFRFVLLCDWWSPHIPLPKSGVAVSGSPGGRGSRLTP